MASESDQPPMSRAEFHEQMWKGFVEKSKIWEYAVDRDFLRRNLAQDLRAKADACAADGNDARARYYQDWAARV